MVFTHSPLGHCWDIPALCCLTQSVGEWMASNGEVRGRSCHGTLMQGSPRALVAQVPQGSTRCASINPARGPVRSEAPGEICAPQKCHRFQEGDFGMGSKAHTFCGLELWLSQEMIKEIYSIAFSPGFLPHLSSWVEKWPKLDSNSGEWVSRLSLCRNVSKGEIIWRSHIYRSYMLLSFPLKSQQRGLGFQSRQCSP